MKKLVSVMAAICLVLLLAVPAFADGRGPEFTEFEIVCTEETPYYRENWDKDGVMERHGSFPAGTTLTVTYEYEDDGVLYGNVQIGGDDDAEWVYVRMDDVTTKEGIRKPDSSQKLSQPHSVRVIEKGGIPLYAGPNKKFDTVTTIPRGTKLTYLYGNEDDRFYRTWAYVSYLNRSGWIYVYAYDLDNGLAELPETDNAKIWVLQDGVQMFDGTSFGNIESDYQEWDEDFLAEMHEEPDRVITTLEKGRQYTYRYSRSGEYGITWYYITAGLRSGWVAFSSETGRIAPAVTDEQQGEYMTFEPMQMKLHEAPESGSPSVTVRIERNTVLEPTFHTATKDGNFYYLTVGDQSGWYNIDEVIEHCAYKMDAESIRYGVRENAGKQPAPIYSDIRQNGKALATIPVHGKITPIYRGEYSVENPDEEYDDWISSYYVRYGDVKGWVLADDLYAPDEEEPETEPEETTDEAWDEEEPADDAHEEDELWEEEETVPVDAAAPSGSLRPMQIVLICVGGAVVLALTAAVTLLLIRRKRREKQMKQDGSAQ